MKYILNWNNEYLDMCIVGGPFDGEAAKQALKETVTERLVKLNVVADSKDAEELYVSAENASIEGETYELHVSEYGASIMYGGGYADCYQIYDYGNESQPQHKKDKKKKIMERTWTLSNLIEGAIFRKVCGFMEVYEVFDEPVGAGTGYSVAHGLFNADDIDLQEVAEAFDCTTLQALEVELGPDWREDAVLCWFDMACRNEPDAYRVRRQLFSSYEEAYSWMCKMSGYDEDEGIKVSEDTLEISHMLTISTAHIRPETAFLLDKDAVGLIVYQAGECGHMVVTTGLEFCGECIPEDLKVCVKYAIEHGFDLLHFDSDTQTVPSLPIYEWD